jgi:hypothetical protein
MTNNKIWDLLAPDVGYVTIYRDLKHKKKFVIKVAEILDFYYPARKKVGKDDLVIVRDPRSSGHRKVFQVTGFVKQKGCKYVYVKDLHHTIPHRNRLTPYEETGILGYYASDRQSRGGLFLLLILAALAFMFTIVFYEGKIDRLEENLRTMEEVQTTPKPLLQ